MGVVSIYCLMRQDSTNTLYAIATGYPTNSTRPYFLLIKSNTSPRSVLDVRWTLVDAQPLDQMGHLGRFDGVFLCTVDSVGVVSIMTISNYDIPGIVPQLSQYVPAGTRLNATHKTTVAEWWNVTAASNMKPRRGDSHLFNIPQKTEGIPSTVYLLMMDSEQITLGRLDPTTRSLDPMPIFWNTTSIVGNKIPWQVDYHNKSVLVTAYPTKWNTTDKMITLTRIPFDLSVDNVLQQPSPAISSSYSWGTDGYTMTGTPGSISPLDQSLYLFYSGTSDSEPVDMLTRFNGDDFSDRVKIGLHGRNALLSLGHTIALPGTGSDMDNDGGPFLIMQELEPLGALFSSVSLSPSHMGKYTKGYYANITDDYTSPGPYTENDPTITVPRPTAKSTPVIDSSANNSEKRATALSPGAIVGIVIGVAAVMLTSMFGAWIIRRRHARVAKDDDAGGTGHAAADDDDDDSDDSDDDITQAEEHQKIPERDDEADVALHGKIEVEDRDDSSTRAAEADQDVREETNPSPSALLTERGPMATPAPAVINDIIHLSIIPPNLPPLSSEPSAPLADALMYIQHRTPTVAH